MLSIKKILFLSYPAGMGHDRAAEALYLSCQKLYPQIQCQLLNTNNFIGPQTKKIFISSYDNLVNNHAWLYGLIFKLTDHQFWTKCANFFSFFLRPLTKKINQQIINFQPDVIVSTHFYTAFILPKGMNTPLYTIITDYYPKVHKIWLAPRVNKFFVATPQIKETLDKMGLKNYVTGIPIHPDFYQIEDDKKISARDGSASGGKDKWGLNATFPTVLFMPTIKGKINIKKTIKQFLIEFKKINLIIITGKNSRTLLEKLSQFKNIASNSQNLLLLSKTQQIDELMKIADVIITKAGGLTLSECLYLQKPTIIINPIPGQEEHNANYFVKQGWANRVNSNRELVEKIKETLSNNVSWKAFISSPPISSKKSASEIILEEIFNHNSSPRKAA